VARGLRLIDEGFLDEASVAELADRLGIGPRHLLRLFLRHTGATPSEIAGTRRVQTAKRLIDQTDAAFRDCLHCRISQRAAVQRRFPGHLWTFAILAPRSGKMIAEMPMLTGGRFCGSIRYEADGKPFHETNCHCSICR
jgi:AraC-like DNA-binding protein